MYKFANLALVVILVLCLNTSSSPIDVPDKIQTIEPTVIHAGRGNAYSNMMVQLISEDGEVQQIHHGRAQQASRKKRGHQQTLSPSIRGVVLDSNFVQVESKKTKNHMKVRQPQPVPRKTQSQKHSMKKSQNNGNKYL